jgi:hypothetical protein
LFARKWWLKFPSDRWRIEETELDEGWWWRWRRRRRRRRRKQRKCKVQTPFRLSEECHGCSIQCNYGSNVPFSALHFIETQKFL